jgi:hypothetical protein
LKPINRLKIRFPEQNFIFQATPNNAAASACRRLPDIGQKAKTRQARPRMVSDRNEQISYAAQSFSKVGTIS